jgi:hypothetical protein
MSVPLITSNSTPIPSPLLPESQSTLHPAAPASRHAILTSRVPGDYHPRSSSSSPQGATASTDSPAHSDAEASRAKQLSEGIEMEPITPAGHRRRRSSLMNPVNSVASSHRSSRPRAQSIRNQANGVDDPKLNEEGVTAEALLRAEERAAEDSFSDEDLHDDEETGLTGKDRRRKRHKRRRNTLLDQRIAREKITAEEKKEADQNVVQRLLINITLIGFWYLFSLSISLVRYPLFTTAQRLRKQKTLAKPPGHSTTSGCSTLTGLTSHFLCSQPQCTCLCNFPLHL